MKSMSGSIWNLIKSDIHFGGQCLDEIGEFFPNNEPLQKLIKIWQIYHLGFAPENVRKNIIKCVGQLKNKKVEPAPDMLAGIDFKIVPIDERSDNLMCCDDMDHFKYVITRNSNTISGYYSQGHGFRDKQFVNGLFEKTKYKKMGYIGADFWPDHSGWMYKPRTPELRNVLGALVEDSRVYDMTFQDFCDNFGYDSDSIKALQTYEACVESARKLLMVFSPSELEELRQ